MYDFDITFEPPAAFVEMNYAELGLRLRSFREPLTQSVREVASPAFVRHFDVEGPGWAPLKDRTVLTRGEAHPILNRTGLLKTVAGQLNLWDIDAEDASVANLPRATYGAYHQFGTQEMVAREWAYLDEDDLEKIEGVFYDWIDNKLEQSGFND
jgi:phage gpG-like protein